MANNNPDTSGLVSLADRPNNERTTIAEQGGIASGKKRRELKRISEIVQNLRQECETDPVVITVKALFDGLCDSNARKSDIIKILQFIQSIEPEFKPEREEASIEEIITLSEIIERHDSMSPEELEQKREILRKYHYR